MKFLRNPEVRRTLWIYVVLTAAAVAGAWQLLGPRAALYVLGVAVVLVVVHLVSTYRRYRHLAELAEDIDRILHGTDPKLEVGQCAEGELCILETEIQKMTIRLREQREHLEEDKIFLADSIADISHQIRTPLTSINLLVQLLRKPDLEEARRIQLLRELVEMLSRIDWLITTLLKISRLDAGTVHFKKEQIPLETLVYRATEPMLIPMELRGQHLRIDCRGSFTGDMDWTCEAIGNIVKNCMEHTPDDGTVTVVGEDNPLYTKIQITDTGPGIASEDLPHLFERFYKGEASGNKGFGIGLALARMIVMGQNGTLRASNLPGGGAQFTVCFFKGTV